MVTCPVCKSKAVHEERVIRSASFDGSSLYRSIRLMRCEDCRHLFNRLSDSEVEGLARYYEEEYAPINLSGGAETDRPGSTNPISTARYQELHAFIAPYISESARILDIGCAMGGLLTFLRAQGYEYLHGIDPIEAYVERGAEGVELGDAYAIPFNDDSFDLVVMDQVLEHLMEPRAAMGEVERVLREGGLCYIGVPDAARYDDVYYYLLREHVQHFTLGSLKRLAAGFEVIDKMETDPQMIGSLTLPNLSVLLKRRGTTYCWGIGREFMYYYAAGLFGNRDLVLVDDTLGKRSRTVDGMKIRGSRVLEAASPDSFLAITAMVHEAALRERAGELGYRGTIIEL